MRSGSFLSRLFYGGAVVVLASVVICYKAVVTAPVAEGPGSGRGVAGAPGASADRAPAPDGTHRVAWVFDGDTVRTEDGFILRYIGIDTPERGEPFYEEAKKRNIELVAGRDITIRVCAGEPTDKYGRTLAWVYAEGVFVNGTLLREGLGRSLIIPPCGLEKAGELRALEGEAKAGGRGLWAEAPGR